MLTCVCQPADARLLWSRQRPNMAPRPRNLTLRPQQPITTPPQKKKTLKDYEKYSLNNDYIIKDENFLIKNGLNVFKVDQLPITNDRINIFKDEKLPTKDGESGVKNNYQLKNGLNVYKEENVIIPKDDVSVTAKNFDKEVMTIKEGLTVKNGIYVKELSNTESEKKTMKTDDKDGIKEDEDIKVILWSMNNS